MSNSSIPFGARATATDVLAGADLRGKRVVVTGGASGLGLETSRALLAAGAEVTAAVRRPLDIALPGLAQLPLDLTDLASVRRFAETWEGPLDVLVANAGIMAVPTRELSAEGWELQLATNFLGHFALARGLRRSLATAQDARIVVVSSGAHRSAPVDLDDLHFDRRPYDRWTAYGQSKSADILLAVAAGTRWADDGIVANALNPGYILTGLQRHVDDDTMRAMGAMDEAGNLVEPDYFKTPRRAPPPRPCSPDPRTYAGSRAATSRTTSRRTSSRTATTASPRTPWTRRPRTGCGSSRRRSSADHGGGRVPVPADGTPVVGRNGADEQSTHRLRRPSHSRAALQAVSLGRKGTLLMRITSRRRSGAVPHRQQVARIGALAALLCVTTVLAACGDDRAGDGPRANRPAAPASLGPGQEADTSLPPVKVGYQNLESTAVALPAFRVGFEAGVKYVNEHLGGVKGHPLEADGCKTDLTPETTINCDNRFVDDGVAAVLVNIDIALDAGLPALQKAGIPVIVSLADSPAVERAQGTVFSYGASRRATDAAALKGMIETGSKNVIIALPDTSGYHEQWEDVYEPVADQNDVKADVVYYQLGSADYGTLASIIVAKNPDTVLLPAANDTDCDGTLPALAAAGFAGKIMAGSCSDFIEKFPSSQTAGIYVYGLLPAPQWVGNLPESVEEDLAVFNAYMEQEGQGEFANAFGMQGFALALNAASMLAQADDPTTSVSTMAALKSAQGALFAQDASYDCATAGAPGSSACGNLTWYGQVQDDGTILNSDFSPIDANAALPE
ncbi:SDR family NAD(P)-dependent oxidoreductase [Nocardioides humi]|nr:SDR family NAD(P)-dependent oxidoreductase [Nocardioides humi]